MSVEWYIDDMRIFGVNLEIKKVPKHELSEQVRLLSDMILDLEKRVQANYRAGEALRKRFERAKIQENGSDDPAAEMFAGQVPPPDPGSFRTGDPWPG